MNKAVKIAMKITADYRYIYDPEHNSKPSGSWKMTGSGWSSNDIGDNQPPKKIVHQTTPEEKNTIIPDKAEKNEAPSAPAMTNEVEEAKETKTTDDAENLFDGNPEESTFDTDDEGKEQEKEQTEEKDDGEELNFNLDDEEVGDAEKLDLDSEEGYKEKTEEDKGIFDDSNKDEYVNEEKYDEYIEKLNSFIEKFDEGEGKENDVTFKAIASNLDWSKVDDVKAFAEHCEKKEIEGAEEIIAFLYFLHQNDEEKFDKIIEDMK